MILLDTSVWIDHLNHGDPVVQSLLKAEQVLAHPYVLGEIALGTLRDRALIGVLAKVDPPMIARHDEVLRLIETEKLFGTGIGYVDAHLLASARITPELQLWTRDRRLLAVATRLGVAYSERLH